MKAVIEFENVDVETGEVMRSQATALASMTEQGMKLTYVEDVSGDGHKTRCTMIFSNNQLRVTRSGELNSDFVYEHGLTHHTKYATGYGSIPVTLQTKHFLHTIMRQPFWQRNFPCALHCNIPWRWEMSRRWSGR